MPDLSGWDDDDISRLGANLAEILDLGQRHPGDLDPQLLAGLSSLDADITHVEEERHGGQQGDAVTSAFGALNDAEAASMLMACAILAGIEEAHSNVLESEFVRPPIEVMADLLAEQRNRRRKTLKEEAAVEPDAEITGTSSDEDIPVS